MTSFELSWDSLLSHWFIGVRLGKQASSTCSPSFSYLPSQHCSGLIPLFMCSLLLNASQHYFRSLTADWPACLPPSASCSSPAQKPSSKAPQPGTASGLPGVASVCLQPLPCAFPSMCLLCYQSGLTPAPCGVSRSSFLPVDLQLRLPGPRPHPPQRRIRVFPTGLPWHHTALCDVIYSLNVSHGSLMGQKLE